MHCNANRGLYVKHAAAKRGSDAVRELMAPELSRWFSDASRSIIGTASRVLEL